LALRTFIGMALVLALLAPLPARAADDAQRHTATFDGRERTYYLYVPDTAAKPLPLIVLLHGSGSNGLVMLNAWRDVAARNGIVLLAPDSLHTEAGWDLHADGPDYIQGLVARVEADTSVDPRRIYLFGQSGGAVYALTLAMLESEYFAAMAIHAGAWRRPAEYKVMDYARRRIPLSISVGDRDEFFSLEAVRDTQRVLTERGFAVEVNIIADHHHAYSDVPPGFNDKVWEFLAAHTLDEDPKFTAYRFAPDMGR
jgi:polyhydroxybutyrate depolymerase